MARKKPARVESPPFTRLKADAYVWSSRMLPRDWPEPVKRAHAHGMALFARAILATYRRGV